ncbi:phosphoribosyl-AMP cyclohydrolase [Amycolatopsis sp. H20-H5]|uniref:phosphoribosyl-AMP cyclohydrolase n=1 Tax=Amycolatopsis sp. H20-H5 TaxID=3046309 RepID=UPI002DBBE898|nr:phosphoribosyl-AMP cyclohydrolase [Amycolatopsis sp. H20-H5]MEC3980048.1 phosphoribosyl-AMP cyclohydrolase [Amycolatopsis sp. H20-H5]
MSLEPALSAKLKRNADGLIAAVVVEHATSDVLMMAWMNDEALELTLTTRRGTYFSRSRQELWVKGETSGHVQRVREVRIDCDGDTVLLRVDQTGPACHTGTHSCFDTDERLLLAQEK